jgi:hypothetical protein
MNIRNTVRTLAVAALLAVTVVTVSAGQADAKPIREKQVYGPIDLGNYGGMCAIQGFAVHQPEDWVFYKAGQNIVVGGVTYQCLTNGRWFNLGK